MSAVQLAVPSTLAAHKLPSLIAGAGDRGRAALPRLV